MKAIGKKLDRYKNPWLELKIQYGQNKGKLYNEECDRFMVGIGCSEFSHLECANVFCWISNMTSFILMMNRYAWFTSLVTETGTNLRQHFEHHPCFDLIGLSSRERPKNLRGGVIP